MNYVVLLIILLIEEKVMSYVTMFEGHGYPLVLYIKVTMSVSLSIQVLKLISQKKSLAAKGKKVPCVTSSSCPWQQKENSKQGKAGAKAGQGQGRGKGRARKGRGRAGQGI